MPSSQPTEDFSQLDGELQEPYANRSPIILSNETIDAIRSDVAIVIPDDIDVVDVASDGVVGKLYKLKNAQADVPCLIWFHGGGYVLGRPEISASLYAQFVKTLGITVFAPKYRLSPEAPYPAASEDGIRAWHFITSGLAGTYGVIPPSGKVGLGGTSAGGGLAACIALKLRDSGAKEQPSGLVLDIPWLDKPPEQDKPSTAASSWHTVKFDKVWSLDSCLYALKAYLPIGTSDPNHYAFPGDHPSLHDLPPTMVNAAEYDIVRDGAINFAMRVMNESKNGAELHVYKGTYHNSNAEVPNARVSRSQDENVMRFVRNMFEL